MVHRVLLQRDGDLAAGVYLGPDSARHRVPAELPQGVAVINALFKRPLISVVAVFGDSFDELCLV